MLYIPEDFILYIHRRSENLESHVVSLCRLKYMNYSFNLKCFDDSMALHIGP
jgi:hypothetical protein